MMKLENKNRYLLMSSIALLSSLSGCGGSSSSSEENIEDNKSKNEETCVGQNLLKNHTCISVENRESIVYKRDNLAKDGIAIMLHGSPGNPKKVMGIFDGENIADKYNLVVVAPKGIDTMWGWKSDNNYQVNTDVDFINALIDIVKVQHNVSKDKVVLMGYSAGGFMNYKFACESPDSITDIISLAGQFRGSDEFCNVATGINIHHIHSPEDKEVPYNGRAIGNIQSVADTIEHWRNINGCSEDFDEFEGPLVTSDSSGTNTIQYKDCANYLALTKIRNVPHESNYLSDELLKIYEQLLAE